MDLDSYLCSTKCKQSQELECSSQWIQRTQVLGQLFEICRKTIRYFGLGSIESLIAIGEWGVWNKGDGHGGGDNPLFIQGMYDFITNPQNNVLFQCYFDVFALDGDHQLSNVNTTNFPDSSALFERLFRG